MGLISANDPERALAFQNNIFSTQKNLAVRIINNPPRLYCILNNIIVDDQQKWHQIAYLVHQ